MTPFYGWSDMILSLRAGLALFFLLCVKLSAGLPVPPQLKSLATENARYVTLHPYTASLRPAARQQDDISDEQIAHITHESSYTFHEYNDDSPILVRRKSLGERMHDLHMKVKAVGQKIKEGFQKVGHFLKTTGAKIAKVGLKIWSTVTKAVSKVVGWIPVIGKPLSRVMDAGADIANKVSDKIKAPIGGRLGNAMKRMDKAQKIMGYIPR